jgi:His/Glu/Gln/Arg/opine family amino acid ABC transporter permease subunit
MLSTMSSGMLKTFLIFALTLIGSLPLGMIVALLRKSRFAPVRGFIKAYISIMRGTPLMLQLLVWYFGPYYLFGWNIGNWRFPAIIVGFVLNYAAYFAEIYRGGIESIPAGQYEAAEVLGYSRFQTFMRIILPQVIKRIMPSVTNEVVTLVKDTSLAFTVSYQEMFTIGKQIANSQTSFTPFVVAGVFYYVFNVIVDYVMGRIEKRLDYYR